MQRAGVEHDRVTEREVPREHVPRAGVGGTLGVGSVVSSHYVIFDPLDGATVTGFIDFDEPIIGLLPLALGGSRVGGLFYYPLARTVMVCVPIWLAVGVHVNNPVLALMLAPDGG